MRATVLFIISVLLAPMCEASSPVVPIISLTIDPPSQTVNSSVDQTVVVTFTGDASVQKLPYVKCTVTLTSEVDVGWQSSVTPSQMLFTSSSSQQFTAMVNIPMGTPSMIANLTINGRAVANGLQSVTHIKAIIDVHGVTTLNKTVSNQTKHSAGGVGGAGGMNNIIIAAGGVGVIAAGGAAGFYMLRRRKTRQAEMALEMAAQPYS
jgi:hypothetical protein